MKNLHGVQSFVESARSGSLSAAARKLDLSPAAISKNVLRLEAELGVRLFNRSTRRLRLTPEGETFLHRAEHILRDLDTAVSEVAQAAGAVQGRVRISVGAAFGRRWVLPLLPALLEQYPGLEIETALDNRPVDLVAEGFDIGIRGGIAGDASLIVRRICALPLILVASTDYVARRGAPRSVDELAMHDLLGVRFSNGSMPAWQFSDAAGARDYVLNARLWVSEPEALLDLALAGCGIAQVGLHHVLPALRAGTLKIILPQQHLPGQREISLHYPHRQYLAPRVKATVDHLLTGFAATPDLHLTPKEVLAFSAGQQSPTP